MSGKELVVKVLNARGLSWKDSASSKSHHVFFLLEVGDVVHKTEQKKVNDSFVSLRITCII